jgi:hypothetical protein
MADPQPPILVSNDGLTPAKGSRMRATRFGLVVLVTACVFAGCGDGSATASTTKGAPSTPPTSPSANPTSSLSTGAMIGATGPFRPTGPMAAARAGQTASLLSTGRVLIAGGGAPEDAAKAELYDPATGTFSPTGPMNTGRFGAAATVLRDGRVLIAGGWSEDPDVPVLASAELYDPTTGKFTNTGSMTSPRADHSAALLSDGRVLITGGQTGRGNSGFTILDTAELFDPMTGTFSPTGSMTVARMNHTTTSLPDGRVLVAGGGGPAGTGNPGGAGGVPGLASAELYDPASGKFTATGRMVSARYWPTATLLRNGHVLIAGGDDGNGPLASAEIYDPARATFATTGSMAAARYLQTATPLPNGQVLVVGGYADHVGTLVSAELYDPNTGAFGSAGSMTDSRFQHTATLLNDGRVLIAAGGSTDESIDDAARLATAELYQP